MKGKKRAQERGQSLVETALVLPILIILMLGVMDLGRAFFVTVALNDAAEEGAVYAAIRQSDQDEIKIRVVDAASQQIPVDPAYISIDTSTVVVGAPITVTVQHELDLYTPLIQSMLPGQTLLLTGQATQQIISVK